MKTEQNYLADAQQIQQGTFFNIIYYNLSVIVLKNKIVKAREKQEVEELTAQLSELKAKEEKMPEIVESYQQQLQLAKAELDVKKKGLFLLLS